MAHPTAKNRTTVTNSLLRDVFVCRSESGSFLKFGESGKAIAFAVIEQLRDGRYFAVVKSLGWA